MELRTSVLVEKIYIRGSLSGNKLTMISQREMTTGKQFVLRIIADELFRVDLNKDYHTTVHHIRLKRA